MSKNIKGIEALAEFSTDLSFSDFRTIRSLKLFHWNMDFSSPTVELIIQTDQFSPCLELCLKFEDVSNFKVNGLSNRESRINGFDIINVKDKGWENVFWEVIDFEDDAINFYARTTTVLSCKKIA